MTTPISLINKLRRPPAVHNWVKNVRHRRDEMAFALHRFAINPPRTSLSGAVKICRQIVVDGISLEQAIACAQAIKDPASRERAEWIARAFYQKAMAEGWKGIQIFFDLEEFYRVSSSVKVPVRPSFVTNDSGKLTLYFLICWARMDLNEYQKRIMTTIILESILSLEDFHESEAYIVCTPLSCYSKKERNVIKWNVRDFDPLSDDEKQELFDRYTAAMSDVERMIIESFSDL